MPTRVGSERGELRHVTAGPSVEHSAREPPFTRGLLEHRFETRRCLRGRGIGCKSSHDPDPPVPRLGTTGRAVGLNTRVLRERQGDVSRLADLHRARKRGWRDANQRHRHSVDLNRLADGGGIAAEARLPVRIGNHRDSGCRREIVSRRECTADDRGHAKTGVIVARHQLPERDGLRLPVDENIHAIDWCVSEHRIERRMVIVENARTGCSENDVLALRPVTGSTDPLFSPDRDSRPPPDLQCCSEKDELPRVLHRQCAGRSTSLTRLKTAVFAPMPRASVNTTTAVKPRFLSSRRSANVRSRMPET